MKTIHIDHVLEDEINGVKITAYKQEMYDAKARKRVLYTLRGEYDGYQYEKDFLTSGLKNIINENPKLKTLDDALRWLAPHIARVTKWGVKIMYENGDAARV